MPTTLYGNYEGSEGGSIRIEEFPRGEIQEAARRAMLLEQASRDGSIVLATTVDGAGAHDDTVWFHPDQDNRLEVIRNARAALEAAEAALLACGYVDNAHLMGGAS